MSCPLNICARQINLIDDGNNGQIIGHGQVNIGDGLSLHSLCGINQQERALTGREAPRHFIREIDVPRRINQMQGVRFPVLGLIPGSHRVGLNRNTTLTFEIHGIEDLIFGLSSSNCASSF